MIMTSAPAPLLGWAAALAIGLIVGVLLGIAAYYLVDRVRVLTGHTYRELRHAGWRARQREEPSGYLADPDERAAWVSIHAPDYIRRRTP